MYKQITIPVEAWEEVIEGVYRLTPELTRQNNDVLVGNRPLQVRVEPILDFDFVEEKM